MPKYQLNRGKNNGVFIENEVRESLGKQSARGGMITISAQVIKILIQLCGTAALSRLLLPADFGLVAMAATITGFISLFSDFGLATATIQRQTVDQKTISVLFSVTLLVGASLFLLAVCAAPVAAMLFRDDRVTNVIILLALAIPCAAAGSQHAALLARSMRWTQIQVISIVSQIIGLAAAIILAIYVRPSYYAIVAQTVIGALVSTILLWTSTGWRPTLTFSIGKFMTDIHFGAYLSGFSFVNYLHDQFDNLLLGWKFGSVELAYYSRAYNLLQMPLNLINNSVSQAAIPALSRLADRHDAWERAFLNVLTACAVGSMALCCTLFVVSAPLVDVILGPGWSPVAHIFKYLAIASIFGSATSACGYAFISLGKAKPFFYWGLFSSPIFAVSYAIGLQWRGPGVAIAYSICMAVLAPIYLAYASKINGFSFRSAAARILPLAISSILTCFIGTIVMENIPIVFPFWRLLISSAVAGSVYLMLAVPALIIFPSYRPFRTFAFEMLSRRKNAISLALGDDA